MTYNSSVKSLKRRKGPVKELVTAAAAVEEAEGDQGHGQGLRFLLGDPLHPAEPLPLEAVGVPALLPGEQRQWMVPLPLYTKSGTMMPTL